MRRPPGRPRDAGASGDAISFACEDTAFYLMEIETYVGHQIPRQDIEPDLLADATAPAPRSRDRGDRGDRGDRRGGRGRKDDRRSDRSGTQSRQKKYAADKAGDKPARTAEPEAKVEEPVIEYEVAPPADPSLVSSSMRPINSKWNNPNIETPAVG